MGERLAMTGSAVPPRRSSWFVDSLHIIVLCAFALAQPVFDLLGRNATFFVAHHVEGADLLLFALALLLGPPVAIILIEFLIRLASDRARAHFHTVVVGILGSATLTPPIVRGSHWPWPVALAVAIILSGVIAALYSGWNPIRDLISLLSPSPVLFLVLFLFWSPVRSLVISSPVSSSAASRSLGTSIVLVVFDEFPLPSLLSPAGGLNRDRFPGFARLADTSTWYREATANVRTTMLSIPTLLSGRFPDWGDLPYHGVQPHNLFTIFSDTHRMNVHEIVSRLCPEEICPESKSGHRTAASLYEDAALAYLHLLLPPDAASEILPPLNDRWSGFGTTADQAPSNVSRAEFNRERAKKDLNTDLEARVASFTSGAEGSTPIISYIHLMMPHLPWRLFPDGTAYNDPTVTGLDRAGKGWADDLYLTNHARQRHLLQARYADALLGRILDKLQHESSFDESLIIVTSDHGANFSPGRSHRDERENGAADVLRVPLFIKFPGQVSRQTDHRPAELVDVLPTITDVLDAYADVEFEGASLRGKAKVIDAPRRIITPNGVVDLATLDVDLSLDKTLSESSAMFGDGRHPDDLFAWGPFANLVGGRTSTLNVGEPVYNVRVHLRNPQLLTDVDLKSGFLPARVLGTVSGLKREGLHLAVALNGTIAGLGETYKEGTDVEFSIIMAPRYFKSGLNTVEFFALSSSGLAQPIDQDDVNAYAVNLDQGRISGVVMPDGDTVPILREQRFKGDVNERITQHGALTVRGWAADVVGGHTPTAVLAVADGRVILATEAFWARRGVVEAFADDRLLMSGFELAVPRAKGALSLVAVYKDSAALLAVDLP